VLGAAKATITRTPATQVYETIPLNSCIAHRCFSCRLPTLLRHCCTHGTTMHRPKLIQRSRRTLTMTGTKQRRGWWSCLDQQ
jgi:hypothetical protein